MPHLPFGTLVDHVRGLGSSADRTSVERHVSACARCACALEALERFGLLAGADAAPPPPEDVVGAAIALFAPAEADPAVRMAALRFDSSREPLPAGDDAPCAGECARVLRFESLEGGVDVELLMVEELARVLIAGQVSSRNGHRLRGAVIAHRATADGVIARTMTTDEGEFRLAFPMPASALLHFVLAQTPVQIGVRITPAPRV